jgi:hypothetical protein
MRLPMTPRPTKPRFAVQTSREAISFKFSWDRNPDCQTAFICPGKTFLNGRFRRLPAIYRKTYLLTRLLRMSAWITQINGRLFWEFSPGPIPDAREARVRLAPSQVPLTN